MESRKIPPPKNNPAPSASPAPPIAATAHQLPPEPPAFDPANQPLYQGTVVGDPALTTPLPVLHWFVQTPSAAENVNGTRCSLFYNGELYDNVFIRIRGGTSISWPKKSYKIEFNDGHHFRFRADAPRVSEIDSHCR